MLTLNITGAEVAGFIEADMTYLRTQGLIEPVRASPFSTYWGTDHLHWEVRFELVMIIEGRNLRYEARWPLMEKVPSGEAQSVKAKGQVCIAAAFQPGTA